LPLLDVVLGYDCNLACGYCTITTEMRARALPVDRIFARIDEAAIEGFRDVAFTGGEPTIFPDLPRLVRHAKARGFEHVKVASNGLRYAYPAYLDLMVESGVDRFHLSMHAPEPAYDRVVAREGAARARRQALANVVSRGLDPVADLILRSETIPSLDAWISELRDQGVRRFALWLVSLTDRMAGRAAELPSLRDLAPTLVGAFDQARAGGYEVVALHVPRCFVPGYEDHVRHPGADAVRVVTPDETFELRGSRLSGGEFPSACDGCAHRARCCGLRSDYVAVHGSGEVRPVPEAPTP
jgi:cyclic pyranopterin phosphate synthase